MMKKAYTLFELIIVIFLLSIVTIYTFKFIKELQVIENENQKIAILKLDMNTTKIFIEKNLPEAKDKLKYDGQTLFFDKNILLKNVNAFSKTQKANILTISITLENKISQVWEFKQ